MLILDATNKSLVVNRPNNINGSAVVSYWSVNTLTNVWTPGSSQLIFPFISNTNQTDHTILAAPGVNEIRVVENVWIHFLDPTSTGNVVKLLVDISGFSHVVGQVSHGSLSGGFPPAAGDTFTLGRDGQLARQRAAHGGTTEAVSNNAN